MKAQNDNKNAAIDFFLYSYFGITADCKKEEMIDACIKRAYLDICRTLTFPNCQNLSKYDSKGFFFLTECAGFMHERINNITDEYDNWHGETCKAITKAGESEKMCAFYGKPVQLNYGHAQKWVNMTMKYLYLLEIILEKGYVTCDWKKLHVPIDSYIMEAFDGKSKDKSKDILGAAAWSNINDPDNYQTYQTKISTVTEGDWPIDWEGPAWIAVAKSRANAEKEKKNDRQTALIQKLGLA